MNEIVKPGRVFLTQKCELNTLTFWKDLFKEEFYEIYHFDLNIRISVVIYRIACILVIKPKIKQKTTLNAKMERLKR